MLKILILFVLSLFFTSSAYAGGADLDYIYDWKFPFLLAWYWILGIYVAGRLIFWFIGRDHKIPLPLTYSQRPWLALILRVTALGLVAFSWAGSRYQPFLIVILPCWFFWSFFALRDVRSKKKKKALHKAYIGFHVLIGLMMVAACLFSFATFDADKRLLRALAYDNPALTRLSVERLISRGGKMGPAAMAFLKNFDGKPAHERHQFINLMKVLRRVPLREAAIPIGEILNDIDFCRFDRDPHYVHMEDVFAEGMATLAVLDKDLARHIATQRLKEVHRQERLAAFDLHKIYLTIIETLLQTNDPPGVDQILLGAIPQEINWLKNQIARIDPHEIAPGWYRSLWFDLTEIVIDSGHQQAREAVLTPQNMESILARTGFRAGGDAARRIMNKLGSPDFGRDESAYRQWWQENNPGA